MNVFVENEFPARSIENQRELNLTIFLFYFIDFQQFIYIIQKSIYVQTTMQKKDKRQSANVKNWQIRINT